MTSRESESAFAATGGALQGYGSPADVDSADLEPPPPELGAGTALRDEEQKGQLDPKAIEAIVAVCIGLIKAFSPGEPKVVLRDSIQVGKWVHRGTRLLVSIDDIDDEVAVFLNKKQLGQLVRRGSAFRQTLPPLAPGRHVLTVAIGNSGSREWGFRITVGQPGNPEALIEPPPFRGFDDFVPGGGVHWRTYSAVLDAR